MEKIHDVFRKLVNTHLERAIIDKQDEIVGWINKREKVLMKRIEELQEEMEPFDY